ncbi:PAN domain-containing protein [Novosphingobium sp. B 225]|uniref:PAN domain-containing protein n=1 Tax=Novosphingobium sp. B 225 TaxID=1961849 RepID=UPI000B4BD15B|nr:PAN domain-containing protein [Novosphingobium sp. B 225]
MRATYYLSGAAFLALSLAGAALGQVTLKAPPVFRPQAVTSTPPAPVAQPFQPLTAGQERALNPSGKLRPGWYRIRSQLSGLCLTVQPGFDFDRNHHFRQYPCTDDGQIAVAQRIALLPQRSGTYTLRTNENVMDGRAVVPGTISNCATVARGVVVGPARIDLRGCDLPTGNGDWAAAGVDDQQFQLVAAGGNSFELRPKDTQLVAIFRQPTNCVAVRDANHDSGANMIKWPCNGNGEQRFMFEYLGPIEAGVEEPLLTAQNWAFSPTGQVRLVSAPGVLLSGVDFNSFETIDDGGAYCMRSCAGDSRCTAWTWSGTGFAGAPKPMCRWKQAPGTATNQGAAVAGLIASGIVRP